MNKIGVLLVNLGTPDSPKTSDVRKYLKEFLLDPRVIDIPWLSRQLLVRGIIAPFRSVSSAKLYKELWTEEGSPLKVYGEVLTEKVQKSLGDDYEVVLAMRYQSPSIESGLQQLKDKKVSSIIILPLFPQYASASTGSVHAEVMRLLSKEQVTLPVKFINSYADHPMMIDAFVERGKEHNIEDYDHVVFSFHGLPVRQLQKADTCNHCQKVENCCQVYSEKNQFCYSAQCHVTAYAIADKLGLTKDQYSICFQSRLGKEPWIEPYTPDILKEQAAAGSKSLLVFCPAFIADCLETTIEVGVEYHEEFEELGGEKVQLVEGLNDSPLWVETVTDLVKNC